MTKLVKCYWLSIPLLSLTTLFSQPVIAEDTGITNLCMEDQAIAAGGLSHLNCTANDVRIADASNISVSAIDGDPNHPLVVAGMNACEEGLPVTFTAVFKVVSTASERYDIGLYFNNDGGATAMTGATNKSCNVYTLTGDGIDLDSGFQIGDVCDDATKTGSPFYHEVTMTTLCQDSDLDGELNLPNCVSWRQSGANELCVGPEDAYPGSPSKCNCDDGFNVDVFVPATITVEKTVSPVSLNEPGGDFTYTLTVTNNSATVDVTIDNVLDDKFGSLTSACNFDVIAAGITESCTFSQNITGPGGFTHENEVTVSGFDANGFAVTDSDTATVTISDNIPLMSLEKTVAEGTSTSFADNITIPEPGGSVTFKVVITNDDPLDVDPLTVHSLIDSVHGDLNGQGTCSTPQTIAPGTSYTCTFTADVTGNFKDSETDLVTAAATDDEGTPVTASDSATVNIGNVFLQIEVEKKATPTEVPESLTGEEVLFTVIISNKNPVDSVTITSLEDSVFGNLHGQGTCLVPQSIPASGSYSCTFPGSVQGNYGDDPHLNVVCADGYDSDLQAVHFCDGEHVSFTDVPAIVSAEIEAKAALVTFKVTITNKSVVDSITITSAETEKFFNISTATGAIESTTCGSLPSLTLLPNGGEVTCTFDAWVPELPFSDKLSVMFEDDDEPGGNNSPVDVNYTAEIPAP